MLVKQKQLLVLALIFALGGVGTVNAESPTLVPKLSIETGLDAGQDIRLRGADARHQLVVYEHSERGIRDVTRDVRFKVSPSHLLEISETGYVKPLGPGDAIVTASLADDVESAPLKIQIDSFNENQPVSFPLQVVPVFTKLSCNGGGCHGKAAGQNGFRLSLLGFYPRDDYEFLVHESRGRRLFPALPEKSLLLTKATAQVPHGGGRRLEEDSDEYRLLRRWIAQGMPYGNDNDPRVVGIRVHPAQQVMNREDHQQLIVLATYSDGSVQDVTRMAQYESNDTEMAEVDVRGLVGTRNLTGDVSVMARFQGQVAVFRATLPLSTMPPSLPEPRNYVDIAVFDKLNRLGIPTSELCDDSTFVRRVTLDLCGRLPTIDETRAFLNDSAVDKRQLWIDRLLKSSEHAEYFASKWSQILRNRRNNDGFKFGSFAFYQWLRDQLYENRPYDAWVRDIIGASGSISVHPPVAWYRQVTDINQRVEDTSQLFLGQRIQCARCHHHPYEKWSQEDYARMAGFFSLVSTKPGLTPNEPIVYSRLGMASSPDPRTGSALSPAGLGDQPVPISIDIDPRHQLVDWMVQKDNPYFAQSLVNRYWKHFFGRGLVDPEDDMRVTNPPSNPELLEQLSRNFIESGFDLRELTRAIVQSHTYQLSGQANELNINDKRNHSRFYPKRLQAEVLLDAIDQTLGTTTEFNGMPRGTRAVSLPDTSFESYFLTVFGRPDASTACECERTSDSNLAQSLHLLNSKQIQAKLGDPNGWPTVYAQQTAADSAHSQSEDDDAGQVRQQIQAIYLRALSRMPREEELDRLVTYIGSQSDHKVAFEDVLWAIINSKEFLFNH